MRNISNVANVEVLTIGEWGIARSTCGLGAERQFLV
jgi:hypothetical protein